MEYITTKTILQSASGGWFGCENTVNLYRGCSHGCVYCDSRSDCYAIKRFDTVRAKRNALSILEEELAHKRKKGVVALGSMSDSYNPCEKELELTRGALQLFNKYGFGVSVDTKSDLVLRDIDVLQSIAKHAPVIVKFTITTAYDDMSRKLEPKVCDTKRRFAALKTLSSAGLYTGVLLTPILPFIEDDSANILSLVDMTATAGCRFVYAGDSFGVTLRDSQRVHFLTKVDKLFPGMKDRYCEAYGDTYYCVSKRNSELYKTFVDRCREKGLKFVMSEIVNEYKNIGQMQQISLFDL